MNSFTIIIPVYNGENHISETVESVIENTKNQRKEILVINDGSTDNTLDILQKYQSEITILSQPNAGEASAVNLGIRTAKGKYLLVVSADDPLISEELFSEALRILENNRDLVAVYPDWQMIDSENEIVEIKRCPEYSFEEMLGNFHCIPGPGTVFRSIDAKEVGGRSSEYKYVSDYDFWLKLAVRGNFEHIPQVLAQWRTHANSTSVGQRGFEMALERIKVISNFLEKYPQPNNLSRQARACSLYNAALLAFFDAEVPGRKWMIEAIRVNRKWIRSSQLHIVVYLLTLPLSRHIYSKLFSSKLLKAKDHK